MLQIAEAFESGLHRLKADGFGSEEHNSWGAENFGHTICCIPGHKNCYKVVKELKLYDYLVNGKY